VKAAQADGAKFAIIYDHYYKPIFLFIHCRLRDEDNTADVTSTVFLKAMLALERYRFTGAPFSAWLFRIAFNEVNMYFRRQKRLMEVPVPEKGLELVMGDAELDTSEKNIQLMVKALNNLPPGQAEMVELRFFERYSFKEIGDIYGIEEATAKMRIYRILDRMKKMMEQKRSE
jgi:RNA polymerase sigma-70 factor (ECF subfamily)